MSMKKQIRDKRRYNPRKEQKQEATQLTRQLRGNIEHKGYDNG